MMSQQVSVSTNGGPVIEVQMNWCLGCGAYESREMLGATNGNSVLTTGYLLLCDDSAVCVKWCRDCHPERFNSKWWAFRQFVHEGLEPIDWATFKLTLGLEDILRRRRCITNGCKNKMLGRGTRTCIVHTKFTEEEVVAAFEREKQRRRGE